MARDDGTIMQAQGDIAALRVVCQRAAELYRWQMVGTQPTLGGIPIVDIAARVKSANAFWVTQSPIDIGLWMGECWWVWEKVVIGGGDFRERGRVSIRATGQPTVHSRF